MASSSPAFALLQMATLATLLLGAAADNGWTAARATWFDPGPDISTANCHFKQSEISTGALVGAFSDYAHEFDGSCGDCYEVRCRPATFKDGYGNTVDRSQQSTCAFPGKSVVVTIADACPCKYPNNAYSNQRWCCNDMPHMDISEAAFQALADTNLGVIGIEWRKVDCKSKGSSGGSGSDSGSSNSGSNSSPASSSPSKSSNSNSNFQATTVKTGNSIDTSALKSGQFPDVSSYFKPWGNGKQRRALRSH